MIKIQQNIKPAFYILIMILVFLIFSQEISGQDMNPLDPLEKGDSLSLNSDQLLLNQILDGIEDIILNSDLDQHNKLLKNIYTITYAEKDKGNLRFIIKEKIPYGNPSKMGRVVFFEEGGLEEDKKPTIVIEQKLLILYPKHKSFVMGKLVNVLTNAYLNVNEQKEFLASRDILVERYLYGMDALYSQAVFYELCENKGFTLTQFETFLIKSNQEDDLAVASKRLFGFDSELTWALVHLKDDVLDEKATPKELLEFIKSMGEELILSWDELIQSEKDSANQKEWEKYQLCIKMLTYHKFIGDIAIQCFTQELIDQYEKEVKDIQFIFNNVNKRAKSYKNQVEGQNEKFIWDIFSDL